MYNTCAIKPILLKKNHISSKGFGFHAHCVVHSDDRPIRMMDDISKIKNIFFTFLLIFLIYIKYDSKRSREATV